MEPVLTSDQELFAATTRKFLEDKADVTTLRQLRHDERGYDPAYWQQGCELGWTSLLVSEDDGGGSVSGEGVEDLALVAYEFGFHASPGPLIATNVVASALSRGGTDGQKADVLGALVAGEIVASWAFPEAGSRGILGAVSMEAGPDGAGWTLTGTKQPVESGAEAQCLLVAARTGDGLTQFLVPADAPGVTLTPLRTIDLTRRFSSVRFEGVKVDAAAVVGGAGDAGADVARQLGLANVMQCAEMVGAMDRAMDITVDWAMARYSFGRPLASYQALKHRFADMKTWLEASHALSDAATRAVQDESGDADEVVSGAKAYIGNYGPELCQECVQMHGGIGVTFEHDMHLFLRRVTLDSLLYGTVTDHRLRLTDLLEAKANAKGDAA
jgi:alkylation response protein AidB-like acyl-CoA dehydrogenase